jgi:hypothetical protein
MALQTYSVYTRCTHCGIYDNDPDWCTLCVKPKDQTGQAAPVPESPAADQDIHRATKTSLQAKFGNHA